MKGKFIFFEGMDFSGKTTSLHRFAEILDERGIKYIITREPGGSEIGEAIRTILLSPNSDQISIEEQAFLFQVARSNHCRNVIQPALDNGVWVLSDRYIVSSIVYQHDALPILKETSKLLNLIEPDYMVYATCGYETTIQRKGLRSDNNRLDDVYTKHYHMYSERFERYACLLEDMSLTIDTNKSIDAVKQQLGEFVDKILGDNNV